jgi:hypothetical protein
MQNDRDMIDHEFIPAGINRHFESIPILGSLILDEIHMSIHEIMAR